MITQIARPDYREAISHLEEILKLYSLPCFWSYERPEEALDTQVNITLHILSTEGALDRCQDLLKWIKDYEEKNGKRPSLPPHEYVHDPRLEVTLWYYKDEIELNPVLWVPTATDKIKIPPKTTAITDLFYSFYSDGFYQGLIAEPNPEGILTSVTFIPLLLYEEPFDYLVESLVKAGSVLAFNIRKHKYYFGFRKRKPILSGSVMLPLLRYLNEGQENEA